MHGLTIGDHLNESGQIWAGVWQCYNCGEIVDSLILKNRKGIPQPLNSHARLKTCNSISRTEHRRKKNINEAHA
jgi:hypothetical protein